MEFKGIKIAQIRSAIYQKKESFTQDWLGRALAYTPYQPRSLAHLKRTKNSPINQIYTFTHNALDSATFLNTAKEQESKSQAFIIESLEILTYIRRYVQKPLIYDFLILDSYQLLESLVYGADCIMLYPKYLNQKELIELSNYALKLGLDRIFSITSKSDLTKAIFAKADILNLNANFSLIPLITNQKILISKIPQEDISNPHILNSLDTWIL